MTYVFEDSTYDYPQEFLQRGQINCILIEHGIQRAVNPRNGQPIYVLDARGQMVLSSDGACEACFLETISKDHSLCPLHGVQPRSSTAEGEAAQSCPICARDPNVAALVARGDPEVPADEIDLEDEVEPVAHLRADEVAPGGQESRAGSQDIARLPDGAGVRGSGRSVPGGSGGQREMLAARLARGRAAAAAQNRLIHPLPAEPADEPAPGAGQEAHPPTRRGP